MRLILFLLLFGFVACGQQIKKYVPDKKAMHLNDSAMQIVMHSNNDSDCQKAIILLDQATKIDTNYFMAFFHKLSGQLQLKQYSKALETAKHINWIRPNYIDAYVTVGILSEKLGDTVTATKYYNLALDKYNKVLDTMNITNRDYNMLLMYKGIDLILVGQQAKGNKVLEQLYNNSTDNNTSKEIYKELVTLFMNKSRKDILENFFNPKTGEEVVNPNN
jgi:tetratricopeptide (TPR) repeat protein